MYDGPYQHALLTHKITGKERDSESGLDNFGARYYDSSLGRFMRPDDPNVDQDPADPQSWNLYSYVRNNPLNSVDPDGNTCEKDKNGNFSGDTCNQDTHTGSTPDKIQVKAQPGSQISSFFLNLSISLSNQANDFFRPITNLMGIEPSFMQNIPPGSGGAATTGVLTATVGVFFIGPEAESINFTAEGLGHIAEGHMVGGALATVGKKSIFNAGEDVKALIKAGERVTPTRMRGGDFARVVDAGRPIGIDRATGAPTSTYTVITKPNGDLVNAFPGKP
jgi:RHS repeat-associated protein